MISIGRAEIQIAGREDDDLCAGRGDEANLRHLEMPLRLRV
jgi:hypothetical protein